MQYISVHLLKVQECNVQLNRLDHIATRVTGPEKIGKIDTCNRPQEDWLAVDERRALPHLLKCTQDIEVL